MKTPQERAVETRRLYTFESASRSLSSYANRRRTLSWLRRLAGNVWSVHGRVRLPVPVVCFGEGTPHGGQLVSYCDGFRYIELVEGQQTAGVLLHELTHAMGYGTPHGKGFVRKYFDLLVEYGRCDRGALMLDAAMFRLT